VAKSHPKSLSKNTKLKVRKVNAKRHSPSRPIALKLPAVKDAVPQPILRTSARFPLPVGARLMAAVRAGVAVLRRFVGGRRVTRNSSGSRIAFEEVVTQHAYSRSLGGSDGVPTDDSTVALGLGHLLESKKVGLALAPTVRSDQISWMPGEVRERVLQASMGHESFARARSQQAPEMTQLLQKRKTTLEDGKDVSMMPQSFQEAMSNARELSAEVQSFREEEQKTRALRRLTSPESPRNKPSSQRSGDGTVLANQRHKLRKRLNRKVLQHVLKVTPSKPSDFLTAQGEKGIIQQKSLLTV